MLMAISEKEIMIHIRNITQILLFKIFTKIYRHFYMQKLFFQNVYYRVNFFTVAIVWQIISVVCLLVIGCTKYIIYKNKIN